MIKSTVSYALIKVDEIDKINKKLTCKKYSKLVQFSGNRHSMSVQLSKWLQEGPLSLATPQLDEAMDQSETPL